MGRTQEILEAIRKETGGLRPHYERYSLLAVADTILDMFGVPQGGRSLLGELGIERADKVVSFILDGLGYLKLEELAEKGLVGLSRFDIRIPLTSVFPPTTTTSLTSLSTGVSPVVHGILGYKLFLREVGAVVNMIKLSTPGAPDGSIKNVGVELEKFVPVPTIYERLREKGVKSYLFLPKYIVNSGLSGILYRGVEEIVAFISLSDLFVLLKKALRLPGRVLLGVYWPVTDTLAHLYGPESEPFSLEVSWFFRAMEENFLGGGAGVPVLVTADHGFVEVDPQKDLIDVKASPELMGSIIFQPVGDLRAGYFFVREGRKEAVREYLERRYPGEFLVMETEAALESKIWGLEEPSEGVRARLGDLVALARGRKLFFWPEGEEFVLRGMHGGLTDRELLVPFLVAYA
ncbi:alkaline phosphatase family protein [Candidatus Bipolaricaulota bacterium]|nr:alkaline phosphatase family protein [Candidatus Bipolaricaulota bacterium]